MKLTLAITTYNRPQMTIESFVKVLDDPRITEIIILDDHSEIDNWLELQALVPKNNKIQLYSNPENVGMAVNKMRAIRMATNEWVILFDSDNVIDVKYLDALERHAQWIKSIIYCPSFARPAFDYREIFSVEDYTLQWALAQPNIDQFLNTCNYVVHRDTYLSNWKEDRTVGECDTIWHNYNHLKNKGSLFVVPGMEYEHRIHQDSGWIRNRKVNQQKFKQIKQLITQLS